MDKEALLVMLHQAVKGISGTANAQNKLNMTNRNIINCHEQDIIAVVGLLALRLATLEAEVGAYKKSCASSVLASILPQVARTVTSYANMLKCREKELSKPAVQGPVMTRCTRLNWSRHRSRLRKQRSH